VPSRVISSKLCTTLYLTVVGFPEQKDIERDKEMREASIMNRLSVLQDKASGRMMKLQEKIWVAVAFQKLRENRKQVMSTQALPSSPKSL